MKQICGSGVDSKLTVGELNLIKQQAKKRAGCFGLGYVKLWPWFRCLRVVVQHITLYDIYEKKIPIIAYVSTVYFIILPLGMVGCKADIINL